MDGVLETVAGFQKAKIALADSWLGVVDHLRGSG